MVIHIINMGIAWNIGRVTMELKWVINMGTMGDRRVVNTMIIRFVGLTRVISIWTTRVKWVINTKIIGVSNERIVRHRIIISKWTIEVIRVIKILTQESL
jgi:hypothetical protein